MGNSCPSAVEQRILEMKVLVLFLFAGAAMASPQFGAIKEKIVNLKSELSCAVFKDPSTCAILFDDDGCDGWQAPVGEGYTKLKDGNLKDIFVDRPKANDAEAVLVRKGCVFVGYDHDKDSSQGWGKSVAIAASQGHTYQNWTKTALKILMKRSPPCFAPAQGFLTAKKI